MINLNIKGCEIIAQTHLRMFLILCCLAATVPGCADKPLPNRVAENLSPETVFATYRRLIEKGNWDSVFELLSPGERDRRVVLLSAFGPGIDKHQKVTPIVEKYFDEEKYDELTKLLNMEVLSQEKKIELYLSCVTDKKRLFVEVNQRLDQVHKDREMLGALHKVIRQGQKAKGLATSVSFDLQSERDPDGNYVTHRVKRETEVPVYFIQQESKWVLATKQEWEQAK